jgi:putative ATP-binding cassette transporter
MGFLNLLSSRAPNKFFLALFLGSIAGILYSLLIPLILTSIAPPDPAFTEVQAEVRTFLGLKVNNYQLAAVYFTSCLLILAASSASEIILYRLGSDSAKGIRTDIYNRISDAPIAALESIGMAKLVASINIDVPRVITGARIIPGIFVNLVTLVGMLGFLLYLSSDIFKLVMLSIVLGIVLYQLPMAVGNKIFAKSREANDASQEAVKGLIFGAKELKLDSDKRRKYFTDILLAHENELVSTEKQAYTITTATVTMGELLSFFVIGAVTFIFTNYYPIDIQSMVGVVMALLYVTGPIGIILNSIPALAVAAVSNRKVKDLLQQIPKEDIEEGQEKASAWQALILKDVTYSYQGNDDEKGFSIGPINLVLKRAQVSFIVGGNGSGKSTISKLITQHYHPLSGALYFDDTQVTPSTRNAFRKEIFAIYSDYYLFKELLIDITPQVEAKASYLLEKLHLSKKVKLVDGKFSTTALSDGQRKRLALLVAMLEDKQLYLFDEWAADQDPEFREIFYTEILPDLKSRGKAVIVISHDDRYFDVADQRILMDQGQVLLLSDEPVKQLAAIASI